MILERCMSGQRCFLLRNMYMYWIGWDLKLTITAHLHKYKIFSIIIFKTFKPKSELYDPAELLLDYTEPRRKRSYNEVRRSMHESQNKLAEKSFSKVEYFMILFLQISAPCGLPWNKPENTNKERSGLARFPDPLPKASGSGNLARSGQTGEKVPTDYWGIVKRL